MFAFDRSALAVLLPLALLVAVVVYSNHSPDVTQAQSQAAAGDDQPAVIRAGAKVVRAITGEAAWLVDLWRQADPKNPPTTSEAMVAPARSPAPSVLLLRRCL